ncbi:MAG: R.Pab1 family restriction endonuclease [Chloroflexi bacterium]|nr:R.Pab1 family restriction endonuclease [Chloroflexota bacterium]
MAEYCDVGYVNGKPVCYLPITTPTGKVRVLRGDQPVATRSTEIREGDVIEWQISYFADERRRMVELATLLKLTYDNSLIADSELRQTLSKIVDDVDFFAEKYFISVDTPSLPEVFHGFRVLRKVIPILQKDVDDAQVWVELRHKQRAVGFQPMLYLRIPVDAVSPSLTGRIAQARQIVAWQPSIPVLFETLRAFSILSTKHHDDMIDVLKRVLGI